MKHIYFLLVIPLVIFFSCSTEPESRVAYYLLKVDSLQHPSSVALNDTIKIVVSGLAGYDGCHSFSHFEGLTSPSSLDLKVWGKVTGTVCLAVLIHFRKEFNTMARRRGTYSINIHQPDGSIMRDSIIVR